MDLAREFHDILSPEQPSLFMLIQTPQKRGQLCSRQHLWLGPLNQSSIKYQTGAILCSNYRFLCFSSRAFNAGGEQKVRCVCVHPWCPHAPWHAPVKWSAWLESQWISPSNVACSGKRPLSPQGLLPDYFDGWCNLKVFCSSQALKLCLWTSSTICYVVLWLNSYWFNHLPRSSGSRVFHASPKRLLGRPGERGLFCGCEWCINAMLECHVKWCLAQSLISRLKNFNLRDGSKSLLSDTSVNSLGRGVGPVQETDHTHVILAPAVW